MRQVQVRGCLPAILMLALLGALVALVISASLAVALPLAGALLVLGLARSLWYRLTGRMPPPSPVTTFRTVRIDPSWTGGGRPGREGDDGPVVEALPRAPRAVDGDVGKPDQAEPGRLPEPGPDQSNR
jgi:hypothetical protein